MRPADPEHLAELSSTEATGKRLVALCIGLAAASLAAGYVLGGRPVEALLILLLGALWLGGEWRGWSRVDAVGLVGCTGVAAAGMWLDLAPGWMLAGVVWALSAWDLSTFTRWVASVQTAEKARVLLRQHLRRLLIVDVVGALLAGAALAIRLRLGLALMLLLGLVLFLGVSRAIRFLRRES
jgi:hypothetical protein